MGAVRSKFPVALPAATGQPAAPSGSESVPSTAQPAAVAHEPAFLQKALETATRAQFPGEELGMSAKGPYGSWLEETLLELCQERPEKRPIRARDFAARVSNDGVFLEALL